MNKIEFEMPAINEIISRLVNIEQKLDEIKKAHPLKDNLLNTKEAAKALGISLRTLQEKRRRLEISFIQHGDIVRFRPQDIQQYLMDHFIKTQEQKGGNAA
jgi:excisionase family DNA binding protein